MNNSNIEPTSDTGRLPGAASSLNLQSYIELTYVKTANDVMVAQMASLESSLSITSKAVALLATLQNLHNMVKPIPKGDFSTVYPGVLESGNTAEYEAAASAFFGSPVRVGPDYGSGGVNAFIAQMASVRNALAALIPALSAATPGSGANPTSLLGTLRAVISDIDTSGADSTPGGASAWLTDKNNVVNAAGIISAGVIQQHITSAITAGQSLNTSQTEAVRNFLYIYEEYYKSAAAVLQQMTQIIMKMADGISK